MKDLDTLCDELVFKHEKHDDKAWCCLREDSVKRALNLYIEGKIKESTVKMANEHIHENLLEYAETGTLPCFERAKSTYDELHNKGMQLITDEDIKKGWPK